MQSTRRSASAVVLAVVLASLGMTATASAQDVPHTLTVQGILRDAAGVPVVVSTNFRFELLDGSRVVWTEDQTVLPRAGLFTLTLGSDTDLDPALFAANLALRVSVAGEAMDPIPLTSVPYAFRAQVASTYDGDVSWGQINDLPAGFADGTDDGNTYAAGTGLTLAGDTFAVDSATVQTRVSGTCPAGQSIRSIGPDGTVTCEIDDVGPPGTTYTAGSGLSLTGTQFDVDTAIVQSRIGSTCPAGQSIRAVGVGGTVTCEVDDNTTYLAGAGLALAGVTFSVDPATSQARVSGTCAAGQSIRAIAEDGTVTCEADDNTTYSAGAGLTLSGTSFSVDSTAVQLRVAGACPAGQSIRAIATDGTVTCEVDDVGASTVYSAGAGLTLTGTTFSLDTTGLQARVTGTCGVGQAVTAIGATGDVICASAGATYSAGTGLALTGTNFSVDSTYVQRRVTATCPAGSSIRAIAADGTVTCQTDTTGADTTCDSGLLRNGVCMLAYDGTSTTDWNTAATTCAGVGGDLCSAAQYLALMSANDGWRPNFFYGRAVWTRNFSDNDGGRVWWLSSSDDPSISQAYSYACCRRVAPTDVQSRGTLIPVTGSTRGVLTTYIHNREDTTFPTAAGVCSGLRSDLCSTAQYVVLNDAGRFGATVRRATPALSDNDASLFSSVLGTNDADNPGWSEYYAFACCASQQPVDGSCPAPGVVVNNVCMMDSHETEDASFFDAARACGRVGADVCSNSQMQNIRNAGRFAGRQSWTNEGADNDSLRVGGILGSQPDNPNPTTSRFGYACCL